MVANFGRQPTVYDATYGFQINILKIPVLHKLAAEAGLHRIFSTLIPDSNIATVSIIY
jgi:hypothetical protein